MNIENGVNYFNYLITYMSLADFDAGKTHVFYCVPLFLAKINDFICYSISPFFYVYDQLSNSFSYNHIYYWTNMIWKLPAQAWK